MTAQAFAEVVGTPYIVWAGPVGTPFPTLAVGDDPLVPSSLNAAWKVLGTNGIENQGAAGVTLSLGRTQSHFTPAGGTLPVKSWTTDEAITVGGSVVDTTIEQFALVLDDAAITTVTAGSGHSRKSMSLVRGVAVEYYALLVRGLSPYDDGSDLACQYEFTRVYQSATQAPKYLKGTPAELAWEFTISGDVAGNDPAQYLALT